MSNDKPPSGARKMIGAFAPKLVDLTDDVLFGDVWERPGLSKRDRSLITVATLDGEKSSICARVSVRAAVHQDVEPG